MDWDAAHSVGAPAVCLFYLSIISLEPFSQGNKVDEKRTNFLGESIVLLKSLFARLDLESKRLISLQQWRG